MKYEELSLLDKVCVELTSSDNGLSALDVRQRLQRKNVDIKKIKDVISYAERDGVIERKNIIDTDKQPACHLFLKEEQKEKYKRLANLCK